MNYEIENLEPELFYPQLKAVIQERIDELIKEIKVFEHIERDRGLFGYEKARKHSASRALTCNENYMLCFDKNFLRFQ